MSQVWTMLVGTFSSTFFSLKIDSDTLEVTDLHPIHNPGERSAFFALSSDAGYLYAANEYMDGKGGVSAFRLRKDGDPEFLNALYSGSQGPAHISVIRRFGRDYLLGSGFFEGDILVCPIQEDGTVPAMSENIRLQPGAHAHGIRPIPGTPFVLATDTAHGLIYTYELTREGKLTERQCFSAPFLEAPRHMTFSKDGRRVFVLTERTSTLEVFDIGRDTGGLTHIAHFSNLPDDFAGESSSAAIHSSPDGRFVYCSNRGHDSLTVYRVDGEEVLKVGYVSDAIAWPREFVIDPEGKIMLVGNQELRTVSVFRMNPVTGIPEFSGKTVSLTEGPASFICLPR